MARICDYCHMVADLPSDVPWRVGVQALDGQGAPIHGLLLHERHFCSEGHLREYYRQDGPATQKLEARALLREIKR